MNLTEKFLTIANNTSKVYDAGYEKGLAESGGSGTEDIEQLIDESGILDGTVGTVDEKIEKLIEYANFKNVIQEALYKNEGSSAYATMSVFAGTSVTDVSMFDFSKVKYIGSGFSNSKIKELDFDVSNLTSIQGFCSNCLDLTSVILRNMTSKITGMHTAFNNCPNLESIETLDVSGITDKNYGVNNAFNGCKALKEIRFVENCMRISISFGSSPYLSNESIQSIINGLTTVETTQTLAFHADVKAKLTQTQLDTITSKNWTLA